MKNLIAFPLFLFLFAGSLSGYWFFDFFIPIDIDIEITKTNNLVAEKNDTFDYFFKQKRGRYEIGIECYMFNPYATDGDVYEEFNDITRRRMSDIFRDTAQFTEKQIDAALVKAVNAHSAYSALITYADEKPAFINRKYDLVNSYLHKTDGVIIVHIMFNDEKILTNKQFNKDIAIFRFK
jgi:hypothetical protein